MNLETLTACPICECTMLSPVTNGRAAGAICGDCQTVFQNPRMDEASTKEFYAGLYRDTVNVGNVNDAQDIDIQRAEEAKQRAEQRLVERTEGLDATRAQAALVRAVNRLRVAGR